MDRAPTAPEQQLDRALGKSQGLPPGSAQAPAMAGKALPHVLQPEQQCLPASLLCKWLAAWLQPGSLQGCKALQTHRPCICCLSARLEAAAGGCALSIGPLGPFSTSQM